MQKNIHHGCFKWFLIFLFFVATLGISAITSTMVPFAKIVNSFYPLNIIAKKNSTVGVSLGYEYVSGSFGSVNDNNNDDDDEVNKLLL